MSKLAKFRNKRKKKNPSEAAELATSIGAGFAGYAATRLLSRMAYAQAVKKFPNASSYIHVAASAVGAAGVYFGSKYWSKVDDYHEAASIGAGIALLQTAIQTYMPKFGWVIADVDASQYDVKPKKELPTANMAQLLPPDAAEPAPQGALGDFDLDALLASNSSIEAVPVGQAPPVDQELPGDTQEPMFGEFGDDPLEHFNGMLQ